MGTRVYRYGLLAPQGEDKVIVEEQLRAAHRYRNVLTEIERARRNATRAVLAKAGNVPALSVRLAELVAAEEEAVKVVKAARKATRSRSETEAMRDTLRRARALRSEAARELSEAQQKERTDPEILARLDEINERAQELVRGARELCGVYWGTYLLVESAMQASKKAPLYKDGTPNDPRFLRYRMEGQIGVQLQNGLEVAKVFGTDRRLQIDPVNPLAWHAPGRGVRLQNARTVLRMRVGTKPDQSPIWASFPMLMARQIPDGAIVKWATVSRRMIGPREEWRCHITVELDEATQPRLCGTGTVAVDVGWRKMGDEMRVAVYRDATGTGGEMRLDAKCLDSIEHAARLRSVRDENFNRARDVLVAFLREAEVPEWLRAITSHLSTWRSQARLRKVLLRWRNERFPGDEEAYRALEAWRYHEHHLWEYESSQRTQALRNRRQKYNDFAADLARRYETVVLEKFDLRTFAERPPAEAPPEANGPKPRRNRHHAGVSELRTAILNAFVARRGRVVHVPAHDSTHECFSCRKLDIFDAGEAVFHTCSGCGARWDQDENAASVLLRRHREKPGDEILPGGARTKKKDSNVEESKWARAKRMSKERKARKEGARMAHENPSE